MKGVAGFDHFVRLGEIDLVQERPAEARAKWLEARDITEDPKLVKRVDKLLQELDAEE
mgnify:CR=1 FL=1